MSKVSLEAFVPGYHGPELVDESPPTSPTYEATVDAALGLFGRVEDLFLIFSEDDETDLDKMALIDLYVVTDQEGLSRIRRSIDFMREAESGEKVQRVQLSHKRGERTGLVVTDCIQIDDDHIRIYESDNDRGSFSIGKDAKKSLTAQLVQRQRGCSIRYVADPGDDEVHALRFIEDTPSRSGSGLPIHDLRQEDMALMGQALNNILAALFIDGDKSIESIPLRGGGFIIATTFLPVSFMHPSNRYRSN